jgi:hypothetical protein
MIEEPRLAPPGAGLPALEHFIARCLFGLRAKTGSREAFLADFLKQREAIRALLAACPKSRGGERVLIRRPIGLEDSSRFWSVWMTLDHLRIVHLEMSRIISELAREISPEGAADTAAVKPDPAVTESVIAEYEASCDALLQTVAAVSELKTAATYSHPWFGPMNAFAWWGLAGRHMGIHRTQLERILAGLPR